MNEDKIIKKLIQHDGKFDNIEKRFDDHDKKFEGIDKRLDGHDEQFDRIINKVIDLDEKIDQVEEGLKKEINQSQDRILTAIDNLAKENIISKQERISTRASIDRIQTKVDGHTKDITKIKKVLKLV